MTDRELIDDELNDEFKAVLSTRLFKEKKEWVGLTDDEKIHLYARHSHMSVMGFVDFIEAKLKEKNT